MQENDDSLQLARGVAGTLDIILVSSIVVVVANSASV
jgi:hypothetical protein